MLGNGLAVADHQEDALSVREAELATRRRVGISGSDILVVQNNLSITYGALGRREEALRMQRDVYSGNLNLNGEEHEDTLRAASNYTFSLITLRHFEEAKALLRETIPMARRVLGENHHLTVNMRCGYAKALYEDTDATLDDLREAVTTLEDAERTARRVFGGEHPFVSRVEGALREARAALGAREGDVEPLRAAVEAMAPGDA